MATFNLLQFGELKKTKPFSNDDQLLTLVYSCLQVDSKKRPTAMQAQQYLRTKQTLWFYLKWKGLANYPTIVGFF